jgi:hypothetical protein
MTSLTFQPISQIVTGITQANPAVVTTESAHDYSDGLYVRIFYPPVSPQIANPFGMPEVAGNVYLVTVLTTTTFSIDVDSTSYEAFTGAGSTLQEPQCIPVGEIASTLVNAEMNNLTPVGG